MKDGLSGDMPVWPAGATLYDSKSPCHVLRLPVSVEVGRPHADHIARLDTAVYGTRS